MMGCQVLADLLVLAGNGEGCKLGMILSRLFLAGNGEVCKLRTILSRSFLAGNGCDQRDGLKKEKELEDSWFRAMWLAIQSFKASCGLQVAEKWLSLHHGKKVGSSGSTLRARRMAVSNSGNLPGFLQHLLCVIPFR